MELPIATSVRRIENYERYHSRLAKGRCVRCGQRAREGKTTCVECGIRTSELKRKSEMNKKMKLLKEIASYGLQQKSE